MRGKLGEWFYGPSREERVSKGSIHSSETEQEYNQKVSMRSGSKDASGNHNKSPSVGTEALQSVLASVEEAVRWGQQD